MPIRHIAFLVDAECMLSGTSKTCPGVEVYAATTHEIDMGLLNDLHCPVVLAFVDFAHPS